MSMFSWSQSASESDTSSFVSNKFWIYWAVTIPLTMLVIILWRVWWLWQERSYQREVKEAVGEANDDESASISSKPQYSVPIRYGDGSTM